MRVLYLTNIPSPYRLDFFNELGRNCCLTVLFEGGSSLERDEKWVGESAISYRPIYLKGIRTGKDTFFSPGVLKVLKEKWDIIVIGMYSTPTGMMAIQFLKCKKIPFFIETDGGFIKDENALKYCIKKHFISSAEWWLSSGSKATEYLCHYGAKRENCFLYPFTSLKQMDIEKAKEADGIERIAAAREIIGAKKKNVILSVGRFTYNNGYGKGYDTLLRAAEHLKDDVEIFIVGDDPTDEFLQWKNEKHLDNVIFIGFKTKEELKEYYIAADVFVLMTRGDVWGLVINEAMMYGLPIITTDKCNASADLVKGNGYIINADDAESLLRKITEIIDNDDLKNKQKQISYSIIENYCIENMAKIHINAFKEVVDGNSH